MQLISRALRCNYTPYNHIIPSRIPDPLPPFTFSLFYISLLYYGGSAGLLFRVAGGGLCDIVISGSLRTYMWVQPPASLFGKSELQLYLCADRTAIESSSYLVLLACSSDCDNAACTRWVFHLLACHTLYALRSCRALFPRPTVSCILSNLMLTTSVGLLPSLLSF
jgi:hypothetical protein